MLNLIFFFLYYFRMYMWTRPADDIPVLCMVVYQNYIVLPQTEIELTYKSLSTAAMTKLTLSRFDVLHMPQIKSCVKLLPNFLSDR